jgi:hypothetical protein
MEPQPRRRRRIARSCVECRRRKIRCDRKDPCTHCVATQLRCIYKSYGDQPSSLLQPTEDQSSPNLLEPLPSLHTRQFRGSRPATDNNAQSGPRTPATRATSPTRTTTRNELSMPPRRDNSRSSAYAQSSEPTVADLLNRLQSLDQPSTQEATEGLCETTRAILSRPSRIESSEWIFSKTRIMRWSLWMGTAKEVRCHYISYLPLKPPADFVSQVSSISCLLRRGYWERHWRIIPSS